MVGQRQCTIVDGGAPNPRTRRHAKIDLTKLMCLNFKVDVFFFLGNNYTDKVSIDHSGQWLGVFVARIFFCLYNLEF